MIAGAQTALVLGGDCLDILPTLPRGCARLAYLDPPFNTGRMQRGGRSRATRHEGGQTGFGGRRYARKRADGPRYADARAESYLPWLMERVEATVACLSADGSLFVHLDPRESHYVKVALDALLGRRCFINEIVWAYDYGGRSKKHWPRKHDVLLWYARDPRRYVFDYAAMDRIPYMAPGLVTAEKAARGKTPTDVWWHTIVPTRGAERTGYPTQKPLGVLERIVRVHSAPGDVVLDPFAGSGTTGVAARRHGRGYVLVDESEDALDVMRARLGA